MFSRSARRVLAGAFIALALVSLNAGTVFGWASTGNKVGDKCYNSSQGAAAFAYYTGAQYSAYTSTSASIACVAYSRSGDAVTVQAGSYDRLSDYHSSYAQYRLQYHNSTGWHNGNTLAVRNGGKAGTTQVGSTKTVYSNGCCDYYRFIVRACISDGSGAPYSCSAWYYTATRAW